MVGKRLGQDDKEAAYDISKYLVKVGLVGSVMIGSILVFLATPYVTLFSIEPEVARLTRYLIYALAIVLFAKITNMILAGGIIRSGGNTHYTLIIDLIGTWVFGVPLALIAGYVWRLPVYLVYFILSQEELIRLILGFHVFRKKKWMKNITKESKL
jgi:Na+-driven multidrug efflux pump